MKTSLIKKKRTLENLRERLVINFLLFTLIFSVTRVCNIQAQDSNSSVATDLWPNIETQLDQQKSDTAFYFIIQLTRDQCGEDFNCLNDTYSKLIDNIEVKFNLPAAVYLSHEMARIAKCEKNLEEEGRAYMNIRRFYDAMGNEELGAINVKKAQDVFEEIGNYYMVNIIKMGRLESSLRYRDQEELIPEMNALIAEVDTDGNARTSSYVHHRMINICLEAELYEDAKRHVEIIDGFIISDSIRSIDAGYDITVASARAEIAKAEKDLVKAEAYYQTALSICESAPSRWLEIATLHSLADLEWERGNINLTKSYLERARLKAEILKIDDFLQRNYAFQAEIAEKEGRYADALVNTKQEYFYSEKIKEKNAGFQMRNYHLQLETEQLKTEKEKQAYDLALQENKLQSLSIILGLGALLTGLLIFGFYIQRKRKKELTAQNALIQKQAERLERLDTAKSRFFANVSHELRTPLTLLLGPISSVLKSGTLDNNNTNYLKMAQRSGKDLLKLVGSILDLSKLESGKLKLEEQPEMFFPLTRRIASTFESYAQQSGIEFTFMYQMEEDLKLKVDRKKFETIVNNLLSNAMKFTPEGGKIAMTIEDVASNIRLKVRDTGRGIHPSDLPNVFDRFYQSEQADAPTEGGTGIGLSLCQNLIKLMGGKISVTSKLNEGSTFCIEFPRKEVLGTRDFTEEEEIENVEQKEVFEIVTSTNKSEANQATIMIVEDNRSLQEYIKALLSPYYKVITAENGQKALEKLADVTAQPALILSDVMMPVMDGFQFLKEIKGKENLRHLPVIMLTARADMEDKLKALRTGVDDYLLKPFEEEELLVRIENLLDNQVARKEVVVKEKPKKATFTISAKDKEWLEGFEIYVKENLTSHLMTVPNLARHFAMSESSLLRQLKSLTGLSPVKYLQEVRLEKARRLLEKRTYESIGRVANEVGYSDARTFSRSYKKRFGKLPSEALQMQ